MYNFEYLRPKTIGEALRLCREHPDSCIVAGGTDALIRYRSGKCRAPYVIDILLPELRGIEETESGYIIGACTSLTTVEMYFSAQSQPYCVLSTAAESVGACQTRNLATIGGNICSGNACADMATPLLVLDAALTIASAEGVRELPANRFFVRNRQVALNAGEIVTAITVPKRRNPFCGAAFMKLGKRRGHVIATLNTAAMVCTDENGIIRDARLAAGTLAPTPIRLYKSEKSLIGCGVALDVLEDTLAKMAETMLTEISPRDSLRASKAYRESTAPVALARTIRMACGQEV